MMHEAVPSTGFLDAEPRPWGSTGCAWSTPRFAHDSRLGRRWIRTISPWVHGAREPAISRKVNCAGIDGTAKNWRGTDGSNPSPSSGESGTNSVIGLKRGASDG